MILTGQGMNIVNLAFMGRLSFTARQNVRRQLETNIRDGPENSVVIAFATGGLAEIAITLSINGLVDLQV